MLVMMLTTLMFLGVIGWFQLHLLRKDGQLFNRRSWALGLKKLFGPRQGFFSKLIGPYLDYYRPGFHPTTELENRWRTRLGFTS